MCDEDDDYDLEYSEDSNSEPYVALQNEYYNFKALKEEVPMITQYLYLCSHFEEK